MPDQSGRRDGPVAASNDSNALVNGAIQLRAHDPKWVETYRAQEQAIRSTLGPRALLVEHVGSTAVPGLVAKPIIDIVLGVANSTDEDSYVPALEVGGYVFHLREPGWYEHRLLKRDEPTVNLHVFSQPCPEIDRMLAFRDRLRSDSHARERYASAKRALAERRWRTVQDYADAKSAFIAEILGEIRR